MGGRIGYSAGAGVMVILLCWFGTISLMLALIPSVAILPILLYIGMLIGSQAFQETPKRHAPAIVLALVPHLAAWGTNMINGALAAAGAAVATLNPQQMTDLVGKMRNEGVLYDGLRILGGGSILGGLVLGAVGVFIIEREFMKASAFMLAGAVMTFFGFMHGEGIGIGESPAIAVSYLAVAAIFAGCAKFSTVAVTRPLKTMIEQPHAEAMTA
jgi:AGZA family xanthine/uracil permease-like MFS transporter